MPTAETSAAAPRQFSPLAGVLSYLVPGLGQIVQGRVGKGLLFFVCVYALFFYGMYLGSGSATYAGTTYTVTSNVYLPDTAGPNNNPFNLPHFAANLYNRPHFAGQFWIGVAAWPAIWHYWHDEPNQVRGAVNNRQEFFAKFEMAPSEQELNELQRTGDKHWDLGWVYTVIAGVLNVLVIYDALAGPAFGPGSGEGKESEKARS